MVRHDSIDIQSLIDYINDTKPYHTKLIDVQVEYQHNDNVNVNIVDSNVINSTFSSVWEVSAVSNGVTTQYRIPATVFPRQGKEMHTCDIDPVADMLDETHSYVIGPNSNCFVSINDVDQVEGDNFVLLNNRTVFDLVSVRDANGNDLTLSAATLASINYIDIFTYTGGLTNHIRITAADLYTISYDYRLPYNNGVQLIMNGVEQVEGTNYALSDNRTLLTLISLRNETLDINNLPVFSDTPIAQVNLSTDITEFCANLLQVDRFFIELNGVGQSYGGVDGVDMWSWYNIPNFDGPSWLYYPARTGGYDTFYYDNTPTEPSAVYDPNITDINIIPSSYTTMGSLGAIKILQDANNRDYYVFEFTTAPPLGTNIVLRIEQRDDYNNWANATITDVVKISELYKFADNLAAAFTETTFTIDITHAPGDLTNAAFTEAFSSAGTETTTEITTTGILDGVLFSTGLVFADSMSVVLAEYGATTSYGFGSSGYGAQPLGETLLSVAAPLIINENPSDTATQIVADGLQWQVHYIDASLPDTSIGYGYVTIPANYTGIITYEQTTPINVLWVIHNTGTDPNFTNAADFIVKDITGTNVLTPSNSPFTTDLVYQDNWDNGEWSTGGKSDIIPGNRFRIVFNTATSFIVYLSVTNGTWSP